MQMHKNPGLGVSPVTRIQNQRAAIASYKGKASTGASAKPDVVREVPFEEFNKLHVAEHLTWRLSFPVRVAGGVTADGVRTKLGISAQLEGGLRFEAQVYRPIGTDGNPVDLVGSGDYGFATLLVSQNNRILLSDDGKYTFVITPTLIAWEPAPKPNTIRAHMGPNGQVIWDAPADAPADAPKKVQLKKNLGLD